MHKIIFLTLVFSYWSNIFSQQLYLTKRDYSDSSNYIHSLIEIDQENGNTISSYDFVTLFPGSYSPESLVFNEQTNQIFGITSGGIIVKFNPTTNTENSFELPNIQSVDYGDLLIVNNSLFVTKRDYSDSSNYIHSLIEIDQENGNTISSYDFVTLFPGSYSPESLVFNEQTNQIFGITSGGIIVKFNPTTNTENSFELPNTQSVDYGDLIIIQDSSLGFNDQFQQNTKLEPIKAYNLLGKEVPLNTKNEIIILVYKNGITKKVLIKD